MESQGRFSGPSEEGWGGGNKTLALALGGEGSRGKVTPSGPSLPLAAPQPWGLLLCSTSEVLQGVVQQGESRFTCLPCCRGTESRKCVLLLFKETHVLSPRSTSQAPFVSLDRKKLGVDTGHSSERERNLKSKVWGTWEKLGCITL